MSSSYHQPKTRSGRLAEVCAQPASYTVRVPTVESLVRASFSFASPLRLALPYGCRHRLRLAPFIQQVSAHAGHTGADALVRAGPLGPALRLQRKAEEGVGRGPEKNATTKTDPDPKAS